MTEDPRRWSQPFAALLGSFDAQMGFGLPSIGGKDSMSGTFNDIDVPPTLVSFAVDVAKEKDIITPEFKAAGNKIVKFEISKDQYDKPVYDEIMKLYDEIHEMIQNGVIISAYAVEGKGVIPAVSKMAFGNKIGVSISGRIPGADLFAPGFGDIIAEVLQTDLTILHQAMFLSVKQTIRKYLNMVMIQFLWMKQLRFGRNH